ncbi:hypothetical protein KRR40_38115 [Niabella defluvii]|nr:hypothetical protein KRR40_38115 [Niabella sp. I65]
MKQIITGIVSVLLVFHTSAQNIATRPLTKRVNVQADTARKTDIIDNEWVAVGINRTYSIQKDPSLSFNGKPSYRFELKGEDNSLEGYEEGSTKGRAELCYCYATTNDYKGLPPNTYTTDQILKMVYDRGKGQCPKAPNGLIPSPCIFRLLCHRM